jgi:hypothetical protein
VDQSQFAILGINLDSASGSILVGVLGLVVAVLAFAADEIRDRRSRRRKSPRWAAWSVSNWSLYRVSDQPPEPPAHPWLARPPLTRLAFWNGGFDTIRSADISQTAPFRITASGNAKLLDVRLLRTNGSGSGFRSEREDDRGWLIDFEYLRSDAGGLFVVSHSGTSPADVVVTGELVEGNQLERTVFPVFGLHGLIPPPVRRLIGDRWAHRLVVIFEILASITVIRLLYADILSPQDTGVLKIFEVLVFLAMFVAQVASSFLFLQGWRETVPTGLRPFDLSDSPLRP